VDNSSVIGHRIMFRKLSVRADWQLFTARTMSQKVYASLNSALHRKVKKATFTSSIDTDSDEDKICKKMENFL